MSNRPLAFTAERLLTILQSLPPADAYLVGFSGGADSTALLHALCSIREQLKVPVSAVHINHNLHCDADIWQSRCEDFCRRLGVRLVSVGIHPQNKSGMGLEADARHLRYEAMENLLQSGMSLLTAHHADDQAETLLLNLMRGSGVDGLSAMPESRRLGNGLLQRPLLGFKGSTLRDYLRDNEVSWTEDPSNEHMDHDRNFMRHEVIPMLEKRWPGISKRLLLTRKAMNGARHLLENLADDYLHQNLLHPLVLNIALHPLEDPELFKLVIRRWVKQASVPSIPVYRLETFSQQALDADSGQNPCVHWGNWILRLYRRQLWLHHDGGLKSCPSAEWPVGSHACDLGRDVGLLEFNQKADSSGGTEIQPATGCLKLIAGRLSVANRHDMETSVISQGQIHKNLKNLFQEAAVPPWLRDCVPLCKLDGELVSIGDWFFDERFAAWLSDNRLLLRWQPRDALLQYVRDQQHAGRY